MRVNEMREIEEMANILWHIPNGYSLNSYNDCEVIAECIYHDGGYRKQKRGEWLAYPNDSFMKCSLCGMEYPKARMPHTVGYCPNPNCGAKMKGGAE